MKHLAENKKLTLFFEGEVNSYNAEDVEKEVNALLAEGRWETIVLDMKDLRYISSAGLRIIVRLKQHYDDLTLINVPDAVYEILEMVGFESLLKIERL